ncbi:formate/nitrite transporter family protein [Priestia flexa]|uniref:formate/nitrite transporter family protein n=1 Tax=Priestia TaxID=2800373 RepID=UPI00203A418D|nr:formate/nitrite transporter family protein [Priestia flexa]MCM3068403.1 formate/nitrite transporter family protein [Priestia flexa]MED3825217.1 formate/nitrite transporter family protein [Priestia flexa]
MFKASIESMTDIARQKTNQVNKQLPSYLLLSMLAGAYVGIGVVLALSVGAPLAEASLPIVSLVMGLSFAIALLLVMFAGAELFTGNHMFYTISTLSGATTWKDTLKNWLWCFVGNGLGAFVLCLLIVGTGLFKGVGDTHLLLTTAAKKMNLPMSELFFRGILCNWLVCLAIWTALRTKSDAAKIMLVFWMLFAFVASGYEHSVANMTFLGLALLHPHPETISLAGLLHNLIPVTLGNIVGGALFVGSVYWFINKKQMEKGRIQEVKIPQIVKEETLSK